MERKPKRTKVTAACAACQTRKSRCELLSEHGCHRYALRCEDEDNADGSEDAVSSGQNVPSRARSLLVHEAQAPNHHPANQTTSGPQIPPRMSRHSPQVRRLRNPERHSKRGSNRWNLVYGLLNPVPLPQPQPQSQRKNENESPFSSFSPDPAEDSTYSSSHSFQNLFSDILPLRELSSMATPRHPLTQSIILGYLAQCPSTINPLTADQSLAARQTMRENLITALSVAPSVPVVRALLIASYLPGFTMVPSPDSEPPLPRPEYVIQVAKSMALALGMNRAEESLVGYADEGWDGEDAAGMDGYFLWRCILQQEFWIAVIMSPHVPVPLAPEPQAFSLIPRDPLTTPISRHVQQTAELQTTMSHVLLRLQRIGRLGPSEDDFAAVYSYFTEFLEEMKRWYASVNKKQARHLYITARQYDCAIHLRLAGWIQRLPRPIFSQWLFQLLQYVGRSLIQSSVQVITGLATYKDLQVRMTGHQHVVCVIAWLGLINIQAMFKHNNDQDWTGRRHANHLDAFAETLTWLYPDVAGVVIRRVKASVPGIKPVHTSSPRREDPWDLAGVNGSGIQGHATSDIRHHQPPAGPSYDWLPAAIPADTSLGTTSIDPELGAVLMPGAQIAAQMPYLGEFTAAEMAAFETWWFDMLDGDGTPGSLPS